MAPKKRPKHRKRKVALHAAKHSLLGQYAPLPVKRRRQAPRVVPIVTNDPYALDFEATLRGPPAGAKTRNGAESEWQAPAKKPIELYASTRDVVAGMYARHQIDHPCFLAARNYQALYERAFGCRVKTVDPSMPPISGGRGRDGSDGQGDAQARLTKIETRLARRYGSEAVMFVREVLGTGVTIEVRADRDAAQGSRQLRIKWWGGLFRRCLRHLAEISGFTVKDAYRNRHREERRRREEERKREEQGA